jgi:Glu-tRNA(Gln) amidotransferase subunit E-like FAD-binding protein
MGLDASVMPTAVIERVILAPESVPTTTRTEQADVLTSVLRPAQV